MAWLEDQHLPSTANNGLWKKLAARHDIEIKYWQATPTSRDNSFSITHKTKDLLPLISQRTRIVAFSACSNILGSIIDVKEVSRAVRRSAREYGARKLEISVDCVAYAPHRRIDVQDWDIDYCAISFYKVSHPLCSNSNLLIKTPHRYTVLMQRPCMSDRLLFDFRLLSWPTNSFMDARAFFHIY